VTQIHFQRLMRRIRNYYDLFVCGREGQGRDALCMDSMHY